jgi:D-alanyl-D-alanine dipeptidase
MRDLLRMMMEQEGFTVNSGEWWHFDYKDWEMYEILDVGFEEIN